MIPLALLLLHIAPQQPAPADIVLRNAKVYTANDRAHRAEAVAIRGNKIAFVGRNGDAQRLVGPNTRVVDLRGAAVFPGFTDSHVHLAGIGAREMNLNLEGTTSLEDFLVRRSEEHTSELQSPCNL